MSDSHRPRTTDENAVRQIQRRQNTLVRRGET